MTLFMVGQLHFQENAGNVCIAGCRQSGALARGLRKPTPHTTQTFSFTVTFLYLESRYDKSDYQNGLVSLCGTFSLLRAILILSL